MFLKLPAVELALERVANRVKQGGHSVAAKDVRRRFHRGWANFESVYRDMVDSWSVYNNDGPLPVLIQETNG